MVHLFWSYIRKITGPPEARTIGWDVLKLWIDGRDARTFYSREELEQWLDKKLTMRALSR